MNCAYRGEEHDTTRFILYCSFFFSARVYSFDKSRKVRFSFAVQRTHFQNFLKKIKKKRPKLVDSVLNLKFLTFLDFVLQSCTTLLH